MYAVIIAVDLRMAFDSISHSKLIEKFKSIGIHNSLLSNYFKNRKQVTKIGNILSNEDDIESGLVQGGICSPSWYNVYTHDIKYLQLKGEIKMFADDTALISINKDLNVAIKHAQDDLITLEKYFYNNSIFMNHQKTETIIVGNIRHPLNSYNKILCHTRKCLERELYKTRCSCPEIEYKTDIRYLGVYIDNEFKFKSHVDIICKKLRIVLYKLNKFYVNNVSMYIKKTIYYSLVESILRYGVTLYAYAPEYVINSLYSLQRKIINKIFKMEQQYLLTPELLCKQILLEHHFHKEEYKQIEQNQYNMRRPHFRRTRAHTNYGTKILSNLIPKLIEEICGDFLDENNRRIAKMKIKEKLVEVNRRNN